jgi:hypothetical protein
MLFEPCQPAALYYYLLTCAYHEPPKEDYGNSQFPQMGFSILKFTEEDDSETFNPRRFMEEFTIEETKSLRYGVLHCANDIARHSRRGMANYVYCNPKQISEVKEALATFTTETETTPGTRTLFMKIFRVEPQPIVTKTVKDNSRLHIVPCHYVPENELFVAYVGNGLMDRGWIVTESGRLIRNKNWSTYARRLKFGA